MAHSARFDFVINLTAAKLGLNVPAGLLVTTDQVMTEALFAYAGCRVGSVIEL